MTAEEISAKMEYRHSRNSVLGRIYRMGLSGSNKHPARPKNINTKPPPAKKKGNRLSYVTIRKASKPLAQPTPTLAPPTIWKQLEDLRSRECRWPYGDRHPFAFCGIGTDGTGPYCPHHTVASIPEYRRRER